ncbi:MAG: diphthine--ammonia ligase [Nitrosopumilaceae archaeon]|nr:diphthine--ammonia ligase [Nitrosopumilaceae archaeon]
MRLAALFSGGKDSTFAIYLAKKLGHEIICLLTIFPKSEDSHLLHHPNLKWSSLQSKAMNIPQLQIHSESNETKFELDVIEKILVKAKQDFEIEGIVHGGIHSEFQKNNFEDACNKLQLKSFSPLWNTNPNQYMNELIDLKFDFVITSVSSGGLDDSWLGKKIKRDDLGQLKKLSEKFEFNLNFEGGEAETFVVNCPLFIRPIEIIKSEKTWDGYRGRFEIVDARLDYDA